MSDLPRFLPVKCTVPGCVCTTPGGSLVPWVGRVAVAEQEPNR
jgi:hypothetical protein